ncbi:MAG: lysostaphin resistance A-like protein [Solirubrobacterales bacterium]
MEATLPTSEPEVEPEPVRDPDLFPFATWGPWKALGAVVAALIGGLMISLPFIVIEGGDTDDLSLTTTVAVQICTAIGFVFVPLLLSLASGGGLGPALGRLGFRSFDVSQAAKWIGIGIVSYLVFAIAYSALIGTPEQDDIAGDFGPIPLQILMIAIVAPIAEETCFRGMLFGGIRNRLPMWAAALSAGIVFGVLHYTTGWSAVPSLIALGAILCIVFEKTDSLWPPIIMHAMNNSVALVVLNS